MEKLENIDFCNFFSNKVKIGYILPLLIYSDEVLLKLLYWISFGHCMTLFGES